MQKKMWLDYPSSISDIVEQNKSFGACSIRVMYTGVNRNRTSIDKDAVEKAIPTLYNCPIVCHYMVEENKIGGHDMAFIQTNDGMRMINLTEPVGVIPSGAQYRWETVNENGKEREYLAVDGILWKRSNAYAKLKQDGISGQSMEITVNDGESVDGVYQIYDFDFTAFCILGEDVEPCFESANVEVFSLEQYKARFEQMMEEFKQEYSTSSEFSSKGGEGKVNLTEMMAKYGLNETDIDFNIDGMTEEEIEAKFAEIQKAKFTETPGEQTGEQGNGEQAGETENGNDPPAGEPPANNDPPADDPPAGGGADDATPPAADPNSEEESDASGDNQKKNKFALMAGQMSEELYRALSTETYHDEFWNEDCRRYWFIDYDAEAQRVFADDMRDNVLCAFNYSMNGDNVVIDFASYKRQKVQFADFDEGEQNVAMFSKARDAMKEVFERKLSEATADMEELRKFHDETVAAQRKVQLDEVFSAFNDLSGIESFEALKTNCDGMSIDEINEKCFAIRGRNMKVNFSANQAAAPTAVRLPVERTVPVESDEPYHGIFLKYGYGIKR